MIVKNGKVYFGIHDISGDQNAIVLDYGAEQLPSEGMGDDTRVKEPGLLAVTLGLEGYWKASLGASVDGILFNSVAIGDVPIIVSPSGVEGDVAEFFLAEFGEYSPKAGVGEIFKFSAKAEAYDKLIRGSIMVNRTSGISDTGVIKNFGPLAAGKTLFASLHVLTATPDSTLDIEVESDALDTFLTPTSRLSFTQQVTTGYEQKTLIGPLVEDPDDPFWRVNWTIGGIDPLFRFIVAMGIIKTN